MNCIECGVDNDSVGVYKSNFSLCTISGVEIFAAEFKKGLCKKCMLANINGFKGELEFIQKENQFVNDGLILRMNHDVIDNI